MTLRTICGDDRHRHAARLAALWRRARESEGYTLTELLVTMAILLIVIGGLTQLMVSGTKAQSDMSKRFEAQQNARLAMDKLRREMHCASAVVQMDDSPLAASNTGIKITLGSYCRTGSGPVIWCTRTTAGVIELYRILPPFTPGAPCVGGIPWTRYLVTGNVFSYASTPAGERTTVGVEIWINRGGRRYHLKDDIVLRNKARCQPVAPATVCP
jgi:prepilin-type N-terminal cleavage/methylation domain-containing protein